MGMFTFEKWPAWLAAQADAMVNKGIDAKFTPVQKGDVSSPKPAYGFEIVTERYAGRMSVWSTGECDFDILDVNTLVLIPGLAEMRVDDETFESMFNRFLHLMKVR